MKIATWNVNSLRARQAHVTDWVKRRTPDVLCLQETKVTDDAFPSEELQRLGYSVVMAGQKTYNGVAIAAREPIREVRVGLLDAGPNDEKRLISGRVGNVHVFCCYVPNGKFVESPSFQDKLRWLSRLRETLDAWVKPSDAVVVCGDFNVAAEERDLFDPELYRGQTHFHPEEHKRLQALLDWGLVDAFRQHESQPEHYSWWDYRGGAFPKNQGLRIDYVFLSEPLASRCIKVDIDVAERAKEKPSDHAPVTAEISSTP